MEQLPLWFLIGALFLPRFFLVVGYFVGIPTVSQQLTSWVAIFLAVAAPRVLVLILIFMDRGMSVWLVIHACAMVWVYLASGRTSAQ